jgi:putative flavoprotein involved in K+ transport
MSRMDAGDDVMTRSVDVLVVGGGQAGIAAGYWLRRTSLRFLLVDGATRIGDSWRRRWDSLALVLGPGTVNSCGVMPMA